MMKCYHQLFLFLATFISVSLGQDYEDYQDYADGGQEDNLYADYAMKQQDKGQG